MALWRGLRKGLLKEFLGGLSNIASCRLRRTTTYRGRRTPRFWHIVLRHIAQLIDAPNSGESTGGYEFVAVPGFRHSGPVLNCPNAAIS